MLNSDTSGICLAFSDSNRFVNKYGNCGFHGNSKPNEYTTAYGNVNNGSGAISEPHSNGNSRFFTDCDCNCNTNSNCCGNCYKRAYSNIDKYAGSNTDFNVDTNQYPNFTPGTTVTSTNGDELVVTYITFCPGDIENFSLRLPDQATSVTITFYMDRTMFPRNAAAPFAMTKDPNCGISCSKWTFSFTALISAPCEGDFSCLPGSMSPDSTKTKFRIFMQVTTASGSRVFFSVLQDN